MYVNAWIIVYKQIILIIVYKHMDHVDHCLWTYPDHLDHYLQTNGSCRSLPMNISRSSWSLSTNKWIMWIIAYEHIQIILIIIYKQMDHVDHCLWTYPDHLDHYLQTNGSCRSLPMNISRSSWSLSTNKWIIWIIAYEHIQIILIVYKYMDHYLWTHQDDLDHCLLGIIGHTCQ